MLARFREDPFVQGFRGGFDAKATTAELEQLAVLLPGRVDRDRRDRHAGAVHGHGPAPVRPRRQRRDPARRDARRAGADPSRVPGRASGAVHRRAGQPRPAAGVNPVVDDVAELTPGLAHGRARRVGPRRDRSRRSRPSASAPARSVPATGSRSRTSHDGEHAPATPNPAPRPWSRRWPAVTRRRATASKEGFAKEVGFYTELAAHRRRAHAEVLVRRDQRRQDELRPPARRPGAGAAGRPGRRMHGRAGRRLRAATSPGCTRPAGTTKRCSRSTSSPRSTRRSPPSSARRCASATEPVRRALRRRVVRRADVATLWDVSDALAAWLLRAAAAVHGLPRRLPPRQPDVPAGRGRRGRARLADRQRRPAGARPRLLPRQQPRRADRQAHEETARPPLPRGARDAGQSATTTSRPASTTTASGSCRAR